MVRAVIEIEVVAVVALLRVIAVQGKDKSTVDDDDEDEGDDDER